MRKFTKYFTGVLVLLFAVVLASCGEKIHFTAQEMADAIDFQDRQTLTFATQLPKTSVRHYGDAADEIQENEIIWTSEDSRVVINDYIISFNYDDNNTKPAKIKGSVTIGKETGSTEFQIELEKESTWEQFMEVKDGSSVSVSGYITYLGEFSASYKNFTMALASKDKAHGYYAYRVSATAEQYAALAVGDYVGLTGEKDVFSKGHQVAKGNVQKLPGESFVQEAKDLTEAMIAGDKLDESVMTMVKGTGEVVSVANHDSEYRAGVKVGSKFIDLGPNKYYYDSSVKDTVEASKFTEDHKAVNDKMETLKVGDTVEFEGVFSRYNDSVQVQLVDPAKLTVKSSNPDKAVVGDAIAAVERLFEEKTFVKKAEVSLAIDTEAKVTYALDDTEQKVFTLTDNKLVVVPTTEQVEVTLTATITKGDVSETVSVKLTSKLPEMPARPENIDVTIAVTEEGKTQKNMLLDGNNAKFIGLDENKWNVTSNVQYEGSTLGIGLYSALRLYSDRDGKVGHKLTITNTEDKNIEYIVIQLASDSKAATFTINGEEYSTAGITEFVIKLESPTNEVVIHNNATSDQLRIDKIEFTFAK